MRMVSIFTPYMVEILVSLGTSDYSVTRLYFQAFDQQQQDLVDAASKALSYRQDIIEENIRLTYALQVTFFTLIFSFKN